MASKKYKIHRKDGVSWDLVFSTLAGSWHVQRVGPDGLSACIPLEEFEVTHEGEQIAAELLRTIKAIENDA